jgi:small-conductance mechanosensitive channel
MPEDEPEEFDDDEGPDKIKNILWYLTLVIGLTLVILYWGLFINLDMLLISLQPWVPKVAVALLTLFVANLFIKLTKPVLKNAYYRRRGKVEEWKVVSMVYSYIIWTFTVLILLAGVFGGFSSLGISIGIIGAGLAFALQQPILSFSGWFLIMLKRPFTIGDRIVLPNERLMGDVEDITMFFFVLKEVTFGESQTGKNVIVPNGIVFQGPIVNYSYDTPHVWESIEVSVTYESDLELAEKIIYDAALKVAGKEMKKASSLIRRKIPDSVQADLVTDRPVIRIDFADSSVNVTARINCLPKQLRPFKTAIYRDVFNSFIQPENKDKVEIAYPHMEVVLKEEKHKI